MGGVDRGQQRRRCEPRWAVMGSYPTGTPAAARHSKRGPTISFFWPTWVGGSCPATPKTGCPPKTPSVLNRRTQGRGRRLRRRSSAAGGSQGGALAAPPRCSRPPLAPFAAEGSLPGKHAHGLRRWAGCARVQEQNHGRLRRPSGLAAARLPFGRKGRGRRSCAAGLAHRRKRVKHWG